jgi:hypothetical protein
MRRKKPLTHHQALPVIHDHNRSFPANSRTPASNGKHWRTK